MKTSNLHIRVTASWLQKLDYLIKQDGASSRSGYIINLIETRYAIDKEVGDLLMQGLAEGGKDNETTDNESNTGAN